MANRKLFFFQFTDTAMMMRNVFSNDKTLKWFARSYISILDMNAMNELIS